MDSTSYAPKEHMPQLTTSGCPVWRENGGQCLENDSRVPPVFDPVGDRCVEKRPADVEADGGHEGAYRAGNGSPVSPGSPVGQSVIGIGGNTEQTLLQVSKSSRRGSFSHLTLEESHTSNENNQHDLKGHGSETGQAAPELPINLLDNHPTNKSDVPNGGSDGDDLVAPLTREEIPVIVSWKDPTVHRSELPSSTLKPTPSEVTDLGDRAFYADLNARGRESADAFALEDYEECPTLEDMFLEAIVNSFEESKCFFPRALLSTLVTHDRVFKELSSVLNQTHNSSQIHAYAEKICKEEPLWKSDDDNRPPRIKSFKKIFVILVLIEQTRRIGKFLEENVDDLDLPLIKKLKPKNKNGARFDLCRNPEEKLECFQEWSQSAIRKFEEWQWTMVAPFFHKGIRKDVQHFPLKPSIILPFTKNSSHENGSRSRTEIAGGYGHVFKVDIHPDHHNFDLPKNQSFAVKCLHSQKKADFKKEVGMLKMFSDNAHPHLISLLATYEQRGVYHLIFPWADHDLNSFWKIYKPSPTFDATTVKWFAKQCMGIAQALVKIHKYQTSNSDGENGFRAKIYVRHGDIKPTNILWFPDDNGGILKITDFGLSESTNHSKSYRSNTKVAASMSYRPPEYDIKGASLGLSYDIWTLGCLYLEFITWLLGTWTMVEDFLEMRTSPDPFLYKWDTDTFFELVPGTNSRGENTIGARVKPAVVEFMSQLHTHEHCSEFLHRFINMIEYDMLIVKPSNPCERGRISSEQVQTKLTTMYKTCDDDLDFLCKPAPWSHRPLATVEPVSLDIPDEVVYGSMILDRQSLRHYDGQFQDCRPFGS